MRQRGSIMGQGDIIAHSTDSCVHASSATFEVLPVAAIVFITSTQTIRNKVVSIVLNESHT